MAKRPLPRGLSRTALSPAHQSFIRGFNRKVSLTALGWHCRTTLDRAYNTRDTNIWTLSQLSKAQKTAIGGAIEANTMNGSSLKKGRVLDVAERGVECDIKASVAEGREGTSWALPTETLGHLVLLLSFWDTSEGSFLNKGWFLVPADCEGLGKPNKDKKRGILKKTRDENVYWEARNHSIPRSFLHVVSDADRIAILSQPAGEERVLEALTRAHHLNITDYELRLLDNPDPIARIRGMSDALSAKGFIATRDPSGARWNVSTHE